MHWKKNCALFVLGGAGYVGLELAWRGRSHISMFLAGGVCFLLLGRLGGRERLCGQLPSLDEELMFRAAEAIRDGDACRGGHLLEAMQHRDSPRWMLLRGEAYVAEGDYRNAAQCFHRAEADFPREVIPRLEICCRELGDFQQAYFYACKQKK